MAFNFLKKIKKGLALILNVFNPYIMIAMTLLYVFDKKAMIKAAGNNKKTLVDSLSYFIRVTPNINYQDQEGNSALHKACEQGDEQKVIALLANGANINLPNAQGNTPLLIAANNFKLPIIEHLLDQPNINIHDCNNDGDNVLHLVIKSYVNVRYHNEYIFEIFEKICKAGIDINKQNLTSQGDTAFHTLVRKARSLELAPLPSFWEKLVTIFIKYKGNGRLNNAEYQSPADIITPYTDLFLLVFQPVPDPKPLRFSTRSTQPDILPSSVTRLRHTIGLVN